MKRNGARAVTSVSLASPRPPPFGGIDAGLFVASAPPAVPASRIAKFRMRCSGRAVPATWTSIARGAYAPTGEIWPARFGSENRRLESCRMAKCAHPFSKHHATGLRRASGVEREAVFDLRAGISLRRDFSWTAVALWSARAASSTTCPGIRSGYAPGYVVMLLATPFLALPFLAIRFLAAISSGAISPRDALRPHAAGAIRFGMALAGATLAVGLSIQTASAQTANSAPRNDTGCAGYGEGFQKVPGSDSCVRMRSSVRADGYAGTALGSAPAQGNSSATPLGTTTNASDPWKVAR